MKRYAKLLAKLLGGGFLLLLALVVLLWIVVPVPGEAQQVPDKKAPENALEPESIPRISGRYE